ncbi:hypothetical protein SELMODRAFT_178788 [Selaginella moellendorffii]|uniref:L-ascorbate oxidase n=1 Tax=Selaginella moellendorffii TaxID=88036 RepID=D8SD87_SELML|nr:monocopper oxidase-like protein SKU5 isoform X4 [Selaginella moellendorffii]EFJ17580.1 hypothetical protein SELMODRAFT_178788 [Selaginella moellendorffii]|eukprot:XP_002981392.1 monocopper oxidase-like protein SKU5 isoform X4 [Selaginella moellendorffii]
MARPALLLNAALVACALVLVARAGDPYQFHDWNVSFVSTSPLGVNQRVIAINGQFPGPELETTTNNNVVINLRNSLDEPLLLTWNGLQLRRDSWQDGTLGTNCPIMPGQNWTYQFQAKDQIGTFSYFPSLLLQRAAGGYGGIRIHNRAVIPVPFAPPFAELTVLIGDWYKFNHTQLRAALDRGEMIGKGDGVLINGRGPYGTTLTVQPGKTYRLRISNVGSVSSLNFRIQGHKMKLVETEGSYTAQALYDSLDVHVGQSYSVLITTDQSPKDFYIMATSRFSLPEITGVAVLHYTNSFSRVSGPFPAGPAVGDINFSFNQARTIKWNLTAGAARPNPQGSFHYGLINISKTVKLANSAPAINGKQRFAVNGISYMHPGTPLKLADFYKIGGVFSPNSIPEYPDGRSPYNGASVLSGTYRSFMEIIFQNNENPVQSWHIDGYAFFVVGMGPGDWTTSSRLTYNLVDAVARSTVQVYAKSWTAIMLELDNVGMWNVRSQNVIRQYLGQEFYMRVVNPEDPNGINEPIPQNVLLCGKAKK